MQLRLRNRFFTKQGHFQNNSNKTNNNNIIMTNRINSQGSMDDESSTFSVSNKKMETAPQSQDASPSSPQQPEPESAVIIIPSRVAEQQAVLKEKKTVTFDESSSMVHPSNNYDNKDDDADGTFSRWYTAQEIQQIRDDNRTQLKDILREMLLANKQQQPSFLGTVEALYGRCCQYHAGADDDDEEAFQQAETTALAQYYRDHPEWQGLEMLGSRLLLQDKANRRDELVDTVLSFQRPTKNDTTEQDDSFLSLSSASSMAEEEEAFVIQACQDIARPSLRWAQCLANATALALAAE